MFNQIVFSPPNDARFYEIVPDQDGNDSVSITTFGSNSKGYKIQGDIQQIELNLDWKIKTLSSGKNESTSKNEYLEQFESCQHLINENKLQKVILSIRKVKQIDNLDINHLLKSIVEIYPKALVYALKLNNTIWIGATPELLLKEKNNTIKTVALAGTKMDANIDWTDKEFEEQRIVRAFIEDKLNSNQLEYETKALETIQSGHLYHLQNEILISLKTPSDFSKILNCIHPTPAISGLPQKESIKAIENIESSPRKLYCGLLGFNSKTNHDYYVNLRCIEVFQNEVVAYAGGGLTKDSNPDKEWIECQEKANSILQFL
jgi:isochorismate synthase